MRLALGAPSLALFLHTHVYAVSAHFVTGTAVFNVLVSINLLKHILDIQVSSCSKPCVLTPLQTAISSFEKFSKW